MAPPTLKVIEKVFGRKDFRQRCSRLDCPLPLNHLISSDKTEKVCEFLVSAASIVAQ